MSDELLKEDKTKILVLGGKEYKLPPMNVNVLANLEEEFDCGIEEVGDRLQRKKVSSLRSILYVWLKDDYPELTKSKIGEMIPMNKLEEVSNTIAELLSG